MQTWTRSLGICRLGPLDHQVHRDRKVLKEHQAKVQCVIYVDFLNVAWTLGYPRGMVVAAVVAAKDVATSRMGEDRHLHRHQLPITRRIG